MSGGSLFPDPVAPAWGGSWGRSPRQVFFLPLLPAEKARVQMGTRFLQRWAPGGGGEFFRTKIRDFLGVFHLLIYWKLLLWGNGRRWDSWDLAG